MGIAEKRKKDQEMAVRLRKENPSEKDWGRRNRADHWPYHSNLGTKHSKPVADEKKKFNTYNKPNRKDN